MHFLSLLAVPLTGEFHRCLHGRQFVLLLGFDAVQSDPAVDNEQRTVDRSEQQRQKRKETIDVQDEMEAFDVNTERNQENDQGCFQSIEQWKAEG